MKLIQPSSYQKGYQTTKKRGKGLEKLKILIQSLLTNKSLPPQYLDHGLSGTWSGWRDCHIEPDWILIYKLTPQTLILGRTGTHSDLF